MRLQTLDEIACAIAWVSGFVFVVCILRRLMSFYMTEEEVEGLKKTSDEYGNPIYENERYNMFFKPSLIICTISVFLTLIIPTRSEMLAIYAIPKIINNEHVENMYDNILNIADKKTKILLEKTLIDLNIIQESDIDDNQSN